MSFPLSSCLEIVARRSASPSGSSPARSKSSAFATPARKDADAPVGVADVLDA
jgi:hypothetical protein